MKKIKDFVSRFDMVMRKYISNGMPELSDIHKGRLLLVGSNLDLNDEKAMLGAIVDEITYWKVTDSLLGTFGKDNVKGEEEKIWLSKKRTIHGKKQERS